MKTYLGNLYLKSGRVTMFSLYWVTTGLVVIMLVLSAGSYLLSVSVIEGFRSLGFPDYFRIQLAILKLTSAVILLIPTIPFVIKEWAYAGVGLFILTAFIAHYAHNDPIWLNIINVLFFITLLLSRVLYSKCYPKINQPRR